MRRLTLLELKRPFLPKKFVWKKKYLCNYITLWFVQTCTSFPHNVWNLTLYPFSYSLVISRCSFPLILIISNVTFLVRDKIFCSFEIARHSLICEHFCIKIFCFKTKLTETFLYIYVSTYLSLYLSLPLSLYLIYTYIYLYMHVYVCVYIHQQIYQRTTNLNNNFLTVKQVIFQGCFKKSHFEKCEKTLEEKPVDGSLWITFRLSTVTEFRSIHFHFT